MKFFVRVIIGFILIMVLSACSGSSDGDGGEKPPQPLGENLNVLTVEFVSGFKFNNIPIQSAFWDGGGMVNTINHCPGAESFLETGNMDEFLFSELPRHFTWLDMGGSIIVLNCNDNTKFSVDFSGGGIVYDAYPVFQVLDGVAYLLTITHINESGVRTVTGCSIPMGIGDESVEQFTDSDNEEYYDTQVVYNPSTEEKVFSTKWIGTEGNKSIQVESKMGEGVFNINY